MFYKIKCKIVKNYDYCDKPMIGERVQILRNISHINKGYDSIYSRKKYIVMIIYMF